MLELLRFINGLIDLYIYIIIGSVILSWLMGFGLINPRNPYVRSLYEVLVAVTEPALRPIRAILPNLGAIDISPIVLLLGLQFVQQVVIPNIAKATI